MPWLSPLTSVGTGLGQRWLAYIPAKTFGRLRQLAQRPDQRTDANQRQQDHTGQQYDQYYEKSSGPIEQLFRQTTFKAHPGAVRKRTWMWKKARHGMQTVHVGPGPSMRPPPIKVPPVHRGSRAPAWVPQWRCEARYPAATVSAVDFFNNSSASTES